MSTPPEAAEPGAPCHVVLVHGGWHGGWAWERLAPLLAVGGLRVHAPTLTGLGERLPEFSADVGFQTHVDDICDTVRALDAGSVTLVGHSYGGSIITAVADTMAERIAALVYLDALIPTDGVAGWHGFPPERQAQMLAGARALGGLQVPPPDPSIWGIEPDSPEHRVLRERLTPHPLKTMTDVPRITGRWRQVQHKYYLLAAGPPASRFAHYHDRVAGLPDWTTAVAPGGHESMWTHPQELASVLRPCIARDARDPRSP
ncbi:MAG: alpha/beta fold hydrolase [Burkholderiales bacterium]|nr:MAG: alpha/beta fold hydrolase [Burkholderiales bacterium]